jgi:hypothetical protein
MTYDRNRLANLRWRIPAIPDLDQVIVRRNASSRVPTLTTGALVCSGHWRDHGAVAGDEELVGKDAGASYGIDLEDLRRVRAVVAGTPSYLAEYLQANIDPAPSASSAGPRSTASTSTASN